MSGGPSRSSGRNDRLFSLPFTSSRLERGHCFGRRSDRLFGCRYQWIEGRLKSGAGDRRSCIDNSRILRTHRFCCGGCDSYRVVLRLYKRRTDGLRWCFVWQRWWGLVLRFKGKEADRPNDQGCKDPSTYDQYGYLIDGLFNQWRQR